MELGSACTVRRQVRPARKILVKSVRGCSSGLSAVCGGLGLAWALGLASRDSAGAGGCAAAARAARKCARAREQKHFQYFTFSTSRGYVRVMLVAAGDCNSISASR